MSKTMSAPTTINNDSLKAADIKAIRLVAGKLTVDQINKAIAAGQEGITLIRDVPARGVNRTQAYTGKGRLQACASMLAMLDTLSGGKSIAKLESLPAERAAEFLTAAMLATDTMCHVTQAKKSGGYDIIGASTVAVWHEAIKEGKHPASIPRVSSTCNAAAALLAE